MKFPCIFAALALAAATATPVAASPLGLAGAPVASSSQMENVEYRGGRYYGDDDGGGAAGVIGGIVGATMNQPCYFNDCGYGYGYGGYYGGGRSYGYGGRGDYGRGGYDGGFRDRR